jgi:hypothetical protein
MPLLRKNYHQDRFFEASDADNPHPWYGPCDAFGPNETCCECQGAIERIDGSIVATRGAEVLAKARLFNRMKRAWAALRS